MSFFSRFTRPETAAPSQELAPAEFVRRYRPGDVVLDVRTPGEFEQGHVAGATNVDVMSPDFRRRVEALGLSKEAPVYLYCRSGNRSGTAARVLRDMGFHEAYNIGGLTSLAQAGAEVER